MDAEQIRRNKNAEEKKITNLIVVFIALILIGFALIHFNKKNLDSTIPSQNISGASAKSYPPSNAQELKNKQPVKETPSGEWVIEEEK